VQISKHILFKYGAVDFDFILTLNLLLYFWYFYNTLHIIPLI